MSVREFKNSKSRENQRHFYFLEWIIITILIIFSLAGVSVMEFSPLEGYWYWAVMTLIFAVAAMVIGSLQKKRGEHAMREIWIEQSLLWFGVLLALCGTLLLLYAGTLNNENAGLVILLILSLAIYIDGIKIGWHFGLVGNFLGLTAVVIAFTENFMWILYTLAAMTIGFTIYWDTRIRSKIPSKISNRG